jgi:hypothetical protein
MPPRRRRPASQATVITPNCTGRWVVVTGIRDLAPRSIATVTAKMRDVVAQEPLGLIFGGARGVDTAALDAADDAVRRGHPAVSLVVVVPGNLHDQPAAAVNVIEACQPRPELVELRLDLTRPVTFEVRNSRMITEGRLRDPNGRPIVVAFIAPDLLRGGTRNTIDLANGWGLEVDEVPVMRTTGGED